MHHRWQFLLGIQMGSLLQHPQMTAMQIAHFVIQGGHLKLRLTLFLALVLHRAHRDL